MRRLPYIGISMILGLFAIATPAVPQEDSLLAKALAGTSDDDIIPAVVIFRNNTPADWNVTILGVGVTFNYDPPASEVVQHDGVNLKTGQSHEITSPRRECVVHLRAAAAVQVGNEEPQIFAGDESANEGECILKVDFVLAPKNTVSRDKATDPYFGLELEPE